MTRMLKLYNFYFYDRKRTNQNTKWINKKKTLRKRKSSKQKEKIWFGVLFERLKKVSQKSFFSIKSIEFFFVQLVGMFDCDNRDRLYLCYRLCLRSKNLHKVNVFFYVKLMENRTQTFSKYFVGFFWYYQFICLFQFTKYWHIVITNWACKKKNKIKPVLKELVLLWSVTCFFSYFIWWIVYFLSIM